VRAVESRESSRFVGNRGVGNLRFIGLVGLGPASTRWCNKVFGMATVQRRGPT
jgi:hypothetical protein